MFKTCNKCNIYKNLKEFHKLERGIFGVHPTCKICRKNNKGNLFILLESKKCLSCDKIYDSNNFYKNKNSLDGLQSYCKTCHKLKISESYSKLDKFIDIMLKKFIKKHKSFDINLNIEDIKKKLDEQNHKCFISKRELTHIIDVKQRSDNISNMAIYINDKSKRIDYNNINLVIHLIYTIKELYKLSNENVSKMYNEFIKI